MADEGSKPVLEKKKVQTADKESVHEVQVADKEAVSEVQVADEDSVTEVQVGTTTAETRTVGWTSSSVVLARRSISHGLTSMLWEKATTRLCDNIL